MIDTIIQIAIVITGGASIYLVGRKDKYQRWGYIAGMLSIPFFAVAFYREGLWGNFALNFWYAFSWGQGVYNYWVKPLRLKKAERQTPQKRDSPEAINIEKEELDKALEKLLREMAAHYESLDYLYLNTRIIKAAIDDLAQRPEGITRSESTP